MAIFNKKPKPEVQMASAPEEPETAGEIKHIENLSSDEDQKSEVPQTSEPTDPKYVEVPVFLSQTQINNMIIENNIMLKQIISNM